MVVRLIKQFQQIGFRLPVTFYFILFVTGAFIAWNWLNEVLNQPESSFTDILDLLLKVVAAFGLALLSIGLLGTVISYAYLLWQKKKNNISFNLRTEILEADIKNKQVVNIQLHPIIKPFLGFIKIRLQYDGENFSNKFLLISKKRDGLFSTAIDGVYYWPLPAIKEYQVNSVIIYFEDLFHFFSFTVAFPASDNFIKHPTDLGFTNIKTNPRKTEESNIKIDDIRKVEGEYLNYKNFEDNDDVRRIVWKVYAKNKELVVRTPETMDPYASHLYLYASFYSSFDVADNSIAENQLLNYYKNYIWSVYQRLTKQQFEVKFIPDQSLSVSASADDALTVKNNISKSNWQNDKTLIDYCKVADASVLIISSLSDYNEVEQLLSSTGSEVTVILVKLTQCMERQHITDWMEWIFVTKEADENERNKTSWSIAPLRQKLVKNEMHLEKLLQQHQYEVFA